MKSIFCVAVLEYDQECDGYGAINPDLYHFEVEDDGSGEVEQVIYERVEQILEDEGYDLENYSISVNKVSEIIKL
jgi:hypothetical protein